MDSLALRSRATGLVERVLKIPPEPEVPAGAHETVRTFRSAPGFYKYQLAKWAFQQLAAGVGLLVGILFLNWAPDFPYKWTVDVAEVLGVITYLAALPVTYLMVRLDFELRWYIVTDRSLRIREGLVHIDEKTMSFANIQNVSVRQGPLQRFFGIADVEVRTAGGGGGGGSKHEGHGKDMHLGYFRGVDNADEIRDAILARVRLLKDSGLGDPDAHHEAAPALGPDVLEAARELLAEARALRHQSRAR